MLVTNVLNVMLKNELVSCLVFKSERCDFYNFRAYKNKTFHIERLCNFVSNILENQ